MLHFFSVFFSSPSSCISRRIMLLTRDFSRSSHSRVTLLAFLGGDATVSSTSNSAGFSLRRFRVASFAGAGAFLVSEGGGSVFFGAGGSLWILGAKLSSLGSSLSFPLSPPLSSPSPAEAAATLQSAQNHSPTYPGQHYPVSFLPTASPSGMVSSANSTQE